MRKIKALQQMVVQQPSLTDFQSMVIGLWNLNQLIAPHNPIHVLEMVLFSLVNYLKKLSVGIHNIMLW